MSQYVSIRTGEIVVGFSNVVKTIVEEFRTYHFLNLHWAKYPPGYFD